MAKLEQYLLDHLKETNPFIEELESYAQAENVPIMDKVSVNFLMQVIRMNKPHAILEIGTAIGYSAIRMAEAHESASITTIERDEKLYNKAIENVKIYNKEDRIHVIYGDALDVLKDLRAKKHQYDFIFIDAAKAQYERFFNHAHHLLNKEGVIVSDNVLFKGLVYENNEENKRLTKLAGKIDQYNKWLTQREDYDTSIVPIGDGVAISVRI